MKCPKCQYISFDSGTRCRNCGYEFSLSADADAFDLPMSDPNAAGGPSPDLSLPDLDDEPADAAPLEIARTIAPSSVSSPPRPITSSFDLPLFRDPSPDDDRPLVNAPAVPRAPLSVRKGTPLVASSRPPAPYEPQFELEPDAAPAVSQRAPAPRPQPHAPSEPADGQIAAASTGARILAGLVDLLILAGMDALVLHVTLKVCDLSYAEIRVVPIAPFAAFLLLLDGGYLTAFTAAGGQSIGKMLARIRVVPGDAAAGRHHVPLGQAVLRAAGYFVSALPIGLGFVPALFGADKRALHDRLAHTRVVKA